MVRLRLIQSSRQRSAYGVGIGERSTNPFSVTRVESPASPEIYGRYRAGLMIAFENHRCGHDGTHEIGVVADPDASVEGFLDDGDLCPRWMRDGAASVRECAYDCMPELTKGHRGGHVLKLELGHAHAFRGRSLRIENKFAVGAAINKDRRFHFTTVNMTEMPFDCAYSAAAANAFTCSNVALGVTPMCRTLVLTLDAGMLNAPWT